MLGKKIDIKKVYRKYKWKLIRGYLFLTAMTFVIGLVLASLTRSHDLKSFIVLVGAVIIFIAFTFWFRILFFWLNKEEKEEGIVSYFFSLKKYPKNHDIHKLGNITQRKHSNLENVLGDVYIVCDDDDINVGTVYLFVLDKYVETIVYYKELKAENFVEFETHISHDGASRLRIANHQSQLDLARRDVKVASRNVLKGRPGTFDIPLAAHAEKEERERMEDEETKERVLLLELDNGDKFFIENVHRFVCEIEDRLKRFL